ncbi:MAG TPA: carboxymuconolactone decarboxylase family protein [Caulobacteraceae bacterium]|jgi:alkylhydroperoxidase family enzyme
MRLPLLPPDQLSDAQRPLYDAFRKQIDAGFTGFQAVRDDGALLGPWSVWIHEPAVGEATRQILDAVSRMGRLSDPVKQIAILAVGARFKAAYEMYAHAAVGGRDGLGASKMAAVCAGQRPADLTSEEATAFDVAMALMDGGVLPGATYKAARDELGQGALNELIQIVALYAFVSTILNAYDVPTEDADD